MNATQVDSLSLGMNTNLPYVVFESGQGGSFLTFDIGVERIALPYLSLTKAVFCSGDRITLDYSEEQVDIIGDGLAELFALLTRAKIEVIRVGLYGKITVLKIQLHEL